MKDLREDRQPLYKQQIGGRGNRENEKVVLASYSFDTFGFLEKPLILPSYDEKESDQTTEDTYIINDSSESEKTP